MPSAALFLMASSMAILLGWQPMPDGGARYEYVVQLEPDLVATLAAGQSIPISSDIPDDIQPLGRIRIVVGSDPLPRTRLTTTLKPIPKKSRVGLVETQHRVAPVEPTTTGRYGNPASQPILPPSEDPQLAILPTRNPSQILPPQGEQGLAGSLQGATQQLGSQLRNVGASVRTDAQQMFGGAGRNAVAGALGQVESAVGRVQQGFQQSVEPLKQVAEQTGQQLRGAVAGIGQRTREVVDRFGRPLREQSIPTSRENNPQAILPPISTPSQQNFAGSQPNARGQRLDQPISPPRDNWQAAPWKNSAAITPGNNPSSASGPPPALGGVTPSTQAKTSNPGGFNSPWPSPPPSPPQNWPRKTPNDRFDLANRPTDNQPQATGNTGAGDAGGRYNSNVDWGKDPLLPPSGSNATPHLTADQHSAHQPQGATGSAAPEIRRNMLDNRANAPLLTADRQPMPPVKGDPPSPSSATQPAAPQATDRQPQAADWGWDNASRRTTNDPLPSKEDPGRSVFPLVLSWVLLSGSGAGNLYLFWSFWDVRNKYRGLVHNARNGGGRH